MEARDCSKAVGGRGPAELAGSVREMGGVGGGGAEGSWKERRIMINTVQVLTVFSICRRNSVLVCIANNKYTETLG